MNKTAYTARAREILTVAHAFEYQAETDKMLWVETNIFPLIGYEGSVASDFGDRLCGRIENRLDELFEKNSHLVQGPELI